MARKSKHVRLFLTAAEARLDESRHLSKYGYTMGAVYLAGYVVECVLKALVVGCHPEHEQQGVITGFRGALAHDYDWLLRRYRTAGGATLPREVAEAFGLLEPWGTDLRYNPRTQFAGDEDEFFAAVTVVYEWARRRL